MPARAQQASGQFFPQTGHNVVGEFWDFYQSVAEAPLVFGLPITEQFVSADGSGLTVQYFEKARFELYPDRPLGERVRLTPLGTRLYRPGAPSVGATSPGACRALNGFGVCYEFLAFFDRNGGLARFGNPLSAFEFQPDGRIIQYFERARFEWYPELPAGQNVKLADLGRLFFNAFEDPSWLNAALPLNNIPARFSVPESLRVMAFPSRAVTLPDDRQVFFVVVLDQAYAPIPGATGTLTVHLPDGRDLVYPLVTQANGIAILPAVEFAGQLPGGLVTVEVEVAYQGLAAATTTSFRVWR